MARPKKSLAKWIGEAIADNEKETSITQLSLVHMKGPVPLEIYKFDKFKGGTEIKEQNLADLFQDKANTHAQSLTGPQTFNVWAFYGQEKAQAYFIFMVQPVTDDNDGNGYLSTESPTEQGMRQQEMRWREMDRGLVYRQQSSLNSYSLQVIEQQARMIDRMQAERFDNGNMVMEMISRMHDNSHKLEMEKLAAQRNNELMATGARLLPAIANTVFNREVFPQSTEDTAIVEGIVDALMKSSTDPADLMGKLGMMMTGLGIPEAMMGILSQRVIKSLNQRQQKAEAEAKARDVGLAKTRVSAKDAEADLRGSGE